MWAVLASGAVLFPGLFLALRSSLRRVFRRWSDADVVLVSERLVSSVHALMATAAGVVVIMSCWNDVIHARHPLATDFVIYYGCPYMTYDLFAMYLSHFHRFRVKGHKEYQVHSLHTVQSFIRREALLVLHHIALLTVLLPITLVQTTHCICFNMTSATPFVSLGKILIQVSLSEGWVHKANGGLVLLTFFLFRIALFPFMYWTYGRHYGLALHRVPAHLPLVTNLGSACILAPQLYWFILLCRKGYRLYRRSLAPPTAPPTAPSAKDQ
uniref:TLC domain-containing protein n=1 Tax=Neogobius melanostomus TaxID=47308 RepID=A0A8C6U9L4_9GOBI